MATRRRTKCLCCGALFTADARNRGRQKYCINEACRRASKAASQQRWLAKPENQAYFRDAQNAARVRGWQRSHPGYWRVRRRAQGAVLQETCAAQVVVQIENSAQLVLQELYTAQVPMLLGLIATLTDSVLQEDMVASSRRLLQLGQDILSGSVSDA